MKCRAANAWCRLAAAVGCLLPLVAWADGPPNGLRPLEDRSQEPAAPLPGAELAGTELPGDLAASGWWAEGPAPFLQRHIGKGRPLEGTSWRNRPIHVGAMVGGLFADDPLSDISLSDPVFGGAWLGYDFGHYWGGELRYGYAAPTVQDTRDETFTGTAHDWSLDVRALYYPWGDAQWRPYLTFGAGMSNFDFPDSTGLAYDETLLMFPWGGGVKYLLDRAVALRLEVVDHFAVGNDQLDAMHNFTYTLGVEWHFGGPARPRYYPYR